MEKDAPAPHGRDLAALARAASAIAGPRNIGRQSVVDHLAWSGFYPGADARDRQRLEESLDRLEAATGIGGDAHDLGETANLLTIGGLAGLDRFWRDHEVETGRRLAVALSGGTGARGVAAGKRRFVLGLTRTFDPGAWERGRPLRLRLPMPVRDGTIAGLTIETEPDARLAGDRIEVTRIADGGPIRIAARYAFTADPSAPIADDADPATWLAPREGLIAVTPRVRRLAERLAGDRRDAAAVMAFRDHLIDGFACGIVLHDRIGDRPATDWVLDHRWYDCLLGAALLAALCRASGIPARIVGGYLLWGAPAEHYWLEAWLPETGWTPYDLLVWGLSAGGTDAGWRGRYAGAIDDRMKTQILPRIFTGAAAPVAGPLRRLCGAAPGGTRARHVFVVDGRTAYTDIIRVTRA